MSCKEPRTPPEERTRLVSIYGAWIARRVRRELGCSEASPGVEVARFQLVSRGYEQPFQQDIGEPLTGQ